MKSLLQTDTDGPDTSSTRRVINLGKRILQRLLVSLIALAFLLAIDGSAPTAAQIDSVNPISIMAYYYIWYNPESWDRGKTDFPLLGRYSSDDRTIMEQHVRWAKDAGIDGFIVSWKGSIQLDHRLETLMAVAAEEHFYLWIIYQGLDFDRNPLPVRQIDADFEYFIDQYAEHPAFSMYERPVLIWSGTWEFAPWEIDAITSSYRDRLYILASERSVEGYLPIADMVDGNAYYWSSINPDTFPDYQDKLDNLSETVHKYGGLWVAPAAPGFDARLIGGTSVVERKNGDTLRREMDVALRSSPDVLGLISWNEFGENTHIEPSQNYGMQALEVLVDMEHGVAPQIPDFDSDAPAATNSDRSYTFYVFGGLVGLVAASLALIVFGHPRGSSR